MWKKNQQTLHRQRTQGNGKPFTAIAVECHASDGSCGWNDIAQLKRFEACRYFCTTRSLCTFCSVCISQSPSYRAFFLAPILNFRVDSMPSRQYKTGTTGNDSKSRSKDFGTKKPTPFTHILHISLLAANDTTGRQNVIHYHVIEFALIYRIISILDCVCIYFFGCLFIVIVDVLLGFCTLFAVMLLVFSSATVYILCNSGSPLLREYFGSCCVCFMVFYCQCRRRWGLFIYCRSVRLCWLRKIPVAATWDKPNGSLVNRRVAVCWQLIRPIIVISIAMVFSFDWNVIPSSFVSSDENVINQQNATEGKLL